MADFLDQGGSSEEVMRSNGDLYAGLLERVQQLVGIAWETAKWADQKAREAVGVEVGNKRLLPETTTQDDVNAVEKAVQDPKNAEVEVSALSTTDQGEVVRATIADPWDEDVDQVVDQALDKLEPLESEAIAVDAVVVEPEQQLSQTQSNERPLVNEFIDKAGENIKQGANNFAVQANAFIAENIKVEYQPIPQQNGTVALALDKPSLLTQMSLAGGSFAQAAKEEMKRLAPQQFERVSQAVKNTQEKVDGALTQVTNKVQDRLNEPSVKERLGGVEVGLERIQAELRQAFQGEIVGLRSQVGNLEGQLITMQQKQAQLDTMIAALQSPKPKLSNPRLNQWQSNFIAKAQERFQQAKQYIGKKIDQVKAKVSELIEGFKQKVAGRLQPVVDRLQTVVNQAQNIRADVIDGVTQARQSVGKTVDNAKRFVGEKALDWQAAAITATATHVLNEHGKTTPMGTTIYEGKHFDFHRSNQADGGSLYIKDKEQDLTVYKDGEFNKNTSQSTKDKLVTAAQMTQKGVEQTKAHKQAQSKAQQQKPKVPAGARR